MPRHSSNGNGSKPDKKKNRTTVYVDPQTMALIDAYCDETGATMNGAIHVALRDMFARHQWKNKPQQLPQPVQVAAV
jgi:hypothetical protein